MALLQTLKKGSNDTETGAQRLRARLTDRLPTIVKVFVFSSVAWILVSAIALFQQTATIQWTTQVWGANQTIKAGTMGMAMHWAAMAFTVTFAVGVLLILRYGDDDEDEKPTKKTTIAKRVPPRR